jgi:hypothetical protein
MTKPARFVLWALAAAPLAAQWVNYPTPGIPRLPDGKPNLSGPAPRTAEGKPDLSGLWEPTGQSSTAYLGNTVRDPKFGDVSTGMKGGLPLQPWAADLLKARRAENGKDDPDSRCLPLGPIKMHLHPFPRRLIQVPGMLVILFERDTTYRQIFTDGRRLPVDPQPSYSGYSTGKWEGDTLVVSTNGLRDGTWLDTAGTPLTAAARLTERFRRPSFGKLEIDIAVDDPKAYTQPWSIHVTQSLAADTDLLEYLCLENQDISHLRGK